MDAQATCACSFTQSDLGPVTELPSGPPAERPSFPHWPAQRLLPRERRDLAVQVLAGAQPVWDWAREHGVRRKFVDQQVYTAQAALPQAFDPEPKTEKWQISVTTAREVLQVQSLPTWAPQRWHREAALRETLRGRYHGVSADVQKLSDRLVRASSLVENLNSRLRTYFFLRRQLGNDYFPFFSITLLTPSGSISRS